MTGTKMGSIKGTVRKNYLSENDATICKECGRCFRMLGKHVMAHGMSPREYRIKYGLPLTVGLVCAETFSAMSESKTELHKNNPLLMAKMLAANPPGHGHKCRRGKAAGALARDLTIRAEAYRKMISRKSAEMWEARRNKIMEMWLAGDSYRVICDLFKCSECTLRNHLRQWGAPKRKILWTMTTRWATGEVISAREAVIPPAGML